MYEHLQYVFLPFVHQVKGFLANHLDNYFSLFDASITRESVAALTLANTTGIVLGFFAFFVPGGIGVREAVATFILAGFMPVREALLAAVCYRAWMILIDGLNALLILGREASMAKRK